MPSVTQASFPGQASFDFEARFYAGPERTSVWPSLAAFGNLTGLDFTDWSAPDLPNIPGPWTEFTDKVAGASIQHANSNGMAPFGVKLHGDLHDDALLARDKMVCATIRFRYYVQSEGGMVWSSWGLWFVGIITEAALPSDSRRGREFTLTLGGILSLLDKTVLHPHSWGRVNIAANKAIHASSTLLDPTPLINRGEFTGANVVIDPVNCIDGSLLGPPWASAEPPNNGGTTVNFIPLSATQIHEVYAWPPPGYNDEYQWFSIKTAPAGWIEGIAAPGYGTLHNWRGGEPNPNDDSYCGWGSGNGAVHAIPGAPQEAEGVVIYCYNRQRAEELFDFSGAAAVIEWGSHAPDFHLSRTRGFLAICGGGMPGCLGDVVQWSNVQNDTNYFAIPHITHTGASHAAASITDRWSGPMVYVGGVQLGQSIARRLYNAGTDVWTCNPRTQTDDDWAIQDIPSPQGGPRLYVGQWLVLDLGDIDCRTDGIYTPPAASMTLATTLGLANSGTALINNQRFTYTGRTATTLTGITWYGNGDAIGDGNPVYQAQEVAGVWEIYHGWRISGMRMTRKAGKSHIHEGALHATRYLGTLLEPDAPWTAEPPGQRHWWQDWPGIGDPINGLAITGTRQHVDSGVIEVNFSYNASIPEKYRFTQLLLRIQHMYGNNRAAADPLLVEDGGLALMNEWEVWADDLTMNGTGLEPNATIGSVLLRILVEELGIPAAKIEVGGGLDTPFVSQTLSQATATQSLRELCASYGVVISERADMSLHIWRDPYWPYRTAAWRGYEVDLDASEIVHLQEQQGPLHTYKQVKIRARDSAGRTAYIGLYPYTPLTPLGEVFENPGTPYVCSDQHAANVLARAMFDKVTSPDTLSIDIFGFMPWATPYMMACVDWDRDGVADPENPWAGKIETTWMVNVVQHEIDFGRVSDDREAAKQWLTTLDLTQFVEQFPVYIP